MKAMPRLCGSGLVAITLALGLSSPSGANPIGDEYQLTITNNPIDAGPATLTFDGIEENVGGPGGLQVSETSTPLSGSLLLEWSFRTADNGSMSGDLSSQALVFIDGVDLAGGAVCEVVSNTQFVYFTVDGAPQAMTDPSGIGSIFGPHPTDPAIQVWFGPFNPGQVVCGAAGVSVSVGPDLGYGTLLPLLSLDPATINDVHFGIQVAASPVRGDASSWGTIKSTYR